MGRKAKSPRPTATLTTVLHEAEKALAQLEKQHHDLHVSIAANLDQQKRLKYLIAGIAPELPLGKIPRLDDSPPLLGAADDRR